MSGPDPPPPVDTRGLLVAGVAGVAVTFVDNSGVVRVKSVPVARLAQAEAHGIGCPLVIDAFGSDDSIAPIGSAVGDLRLRPDLAALTVLAAQPGWAWAPGDRLTTDGHPHPGCSRHAATVAEARLAADGFEVRAAFETEWVLDAGTGDDLVAVTTGAAYGMSRLVDVADLGRQLLDALAAEGVEVEQLHPEYGPSQMELSVVPTTAVTAADRVVLVRSTIAAVSRRHGHRVSFAPVVAPDVVGNGTHLHLSLWRDGRSMMTGGPGRHGLHPEGEAWVAGILDAVAALVAVGAPGVASHLRLQPGRWSAPWACWGRENREAALRLVTGSASRHGSGANVELKAVDATANPYLLVAAVMAAGADGLASAGHPARRGHRRPGRHERRRAVRRRGDPPADRGGGRPRRLRGVGAARRPRLGPVRHLRGGAAGGGGAPGRRGTRGCGPGRPLGVVTATAGAPTVAAGVLGHLEEAQLELVDHHCHSVVASDLDRAAFERLLGEGGRPAPPGCSALDTHLSMAVRSWCAPVLGLPAGAPAEEYLARRAELGADEVNRRFLGTGAATVVVDTGHRAGELAPLDRLRSWVPGPVLEVARLEVVAEDIEDPGRRAAVPSAARWADAVADEVDRRRPSVAGWKSVAAYRGGLDLDWSRPSPTAVAAAVREWRAARTADGPPRMDHPVLIRHLVWAAVDTDMPLQVHTGFGDTDLTLHRANPSLLSPLLAATADAGGPIMLLHCWPYQREAGYLASVWPHVYVDVGLALPHVGHRAPEVFAELLELAPWHKILYSSDAFGLAELHLLAARLHLAAVADALAPLAAAGYPPEETSRLAALVTGGNARRAYPALGPPAPHPAPPGPPPVPGRPRAAGVCG